jgi:hypothetical protein
MVIAQDRSGSVLWNRSIFFSFDGSRCLQTRWMDQCTAMSKKFFFDESDLVEVNEDQIYCYFRCMLILDLPFGLLVLEILRYAILILFVVAFVGILFSKQLTKTQRRGFWLDMLLFPLGLIYEVVSSAFSFRKPKKKQ